MALPAALPDIPPLESGDRLSREEFHRRYEQRPDIKKAELVDGVVYVASPVRTDHSAAHGAIVTWLGVYAAAHGDVGMNDNMTLILGDSEVQPDALIRRLENGTSTVTTDRYLEGPPELVAEVAASSASYDLHQKRALYERSGVQEYIVWQVYDRAIRWFNLRDGQYQDLHPGEDGIFESDVFPGLRLDVDSMLNGDMSAVLAALSGET